MKLLTVLIFLFQCYNFYFCEELVGLAVVVNHGDTIPDKFYPNDPYKNSTIWPKNSLGQLSNLGKQQTYSIGQWLRRRYMTKTPFLTLHYNASQIYTFSEDRDESLMSAECIMAGLYPPIGDEIWNERIHWRPTPVHSSPLFLDKAIGRGVFCPKYNIELEKVLHGRFLRNLNNADKDFLEFLSEQTGEKIMNVDQIPTLFNILTVEKNHGLTLPAWTKSVYPGLLSKIVLQTSILRTKNPPLAHLSIGPFFNKLLMQFQAIISKNPNLGNTNMDLRKFKMYISNDTLIYDTLNVLQIPTDRIVSSASVLIFELWKNDGQHGDDRDFDIKMLFKHSSEKHASATPIKIARCRSFKCSFGKFQEMLHNYALDDTKWNQTCFNSFNV